MTTIQPGSLWRHSKSGNWPVNWPLLSPRYDGAYAPVKGIEDP